MVHVPAEMPVTMPVPEPTVAIEVLLLLQWPPVMASVSVLVLPTHALAVPPIVPADVPPVTVTIT